MTRAGTSRSSMMACSNAGWPPTIAAFGARAHQRCAWG
jgi:hypothetical protein